MCEPTASDTADAGSPFGRESDEAATEAVVARVSEVTGRSPLELDPLSEVIDADALNRVFRGDDEPPHVTVSFEYCEQQVTVSAAGVEVDEPASNEE